MNESDAQFGGIDEATWDALYQAALEAREQAYTPYSEFDVGAALLGASGQIYRGCNVENASIGATVCAERTAIGNAVTHGERTPTAICVVTDMDEPAAPCGICRQVLAEFSRELPILLANLAGDRELVTLDELLPRRFGRADLPKA